MIAKKVQLQNDVPLLPARQLTAGHITCLYEQGNLRYIRMGENEVLRMIYGAVRDENWETVPCTTEDELVEISSHGFEIKYTAHYTLNDIQYQAKFLMEADAAGTFNISMQGEALSDFKRNRIGFCVHHSVQECAGQEVKITQPDGAVYTAVFPELVDPQQPFKNVQRMQWTTQSGVAVDLQFEGDVFETEDQRNWSDDSYKTYGTPLELPFPVLVKKGAQVKQSITLRLSDIGAVVQPNADKTFHEEKVPFPKIGYSRNGKPLSPECIRLLQQIPLDYYRVELHLDVPGWEQVLSEAAAEAGALQTRLELIIFFSDVEQEIAQLLQNIAPCSGQVYSVLVLHRRYKTTPLELMQVVYENIKKPFPHIQVGYGTDAYFAELNRNLPEDVLFDFVSFSINPQVHATDSRSVWENLGSQANIIRTLKTHLPGVAIHVSPITLKKRGNPDATGDVDAEAAVLLANDSRQHTWFAAMWTLCAIHNLGAADRLTFYQAVGEQGVLREADVAENREMLSPLFQVLQQIKEFDPKWIVRRPDVQHELFLENETGAQLLFSCGGKFR